MTRDTLKLRKHPVINSIPIFCRLRRKKLVDKEASRRFVTNTSNPLNKRKSGTGNSLVFPRQKSLSALPTTQVSVERLFSGLKLFLSDLRFRLKPDIVKADSPAENQLCGRGLR
ncbi:unnamed protein product, partial [Cyprideis torosa]